MRIRSRSSVTINGQTFTGNSVSIVNGKVTIDGVAQGESLAGPITVTVNGNAESIETESGDVTVTGNAGAVKTMSGDVTCAAVSGNVKTMSGSVHCQDVAGSVETMSGKITHR